MRRPLLILLVAGALVAAAAPASAQYRPGYAGPTKPAAGLCRVWRPGGAVSGSMDCRRAEFEAERLGGRVIYGEAYDRDQRREGDRPARRDDDARRDRDQDRDRRAGRDHGDNRRDGRICVSRDWHGHCLRTEKRRR